ncbi:hypothetical protein DVH24_015057 [Malus domestica]|uniref:Serpin domain-containing protein n=1 Tax=Malus domestica TaxID=3750 RepID=A0A498K2Y7_MALDO|nr:hypothetical protein DVH24_015057 [Malus domestica]
MASPLKLISCSLFLFFSFIFWSKKPPIHPNIIAKTLTTPPVQLPVIARDRDLSDLRIFVRSQTAAAMRITKPLLLSEAKDKNMVFSPLSIHIVLSLIAAGTKGPARDQLLSFLKSNSTAELNALAADLVLLVLADGSASGGPRLSFANGLWGVFEILNHGEFTFETVDNHEEQTVLLKREFQSGTIKSKSFNPVYTPKYVKYLARVITPIYSRPYPNTSPF